jgi:SAM-dependent methyltransferase
MSLSGGYVSDIGYTAGFYPETAPAHIAFAALCGANSPGLAWRPRRILELGFGQGFGLALLAAANPDIAFEGYDFNAEHVAHARTLIDSATLANLGVKNASFEDAAGEGDRDVDVVILHGVLSWIDATSQQAVVSILRRRLRPNGLVYVSYNCMPGWAPLAPIRRLILQVKHRNPGRSAHQIALALDLLGKLRRSNAGYLSVNPIAADHVSAMLDMDRAYLAHEYLADRTEVPDFSDIAGILAPAGLTYIASATLLDNFAEYAVPESVRPILPEIGDPILQQVVGDFAANKKFRRDLYARGAPTFAPAERRQLLSELRFTLCIPRARLTLRFLGPVGEITLRPEFHAVVADLLARRAATFDELLALPPFGGNRVDLLVDCLALLIHSGQVLPISPEPCSDMLPAQRFNRVVVECARSGRFYGHLASPVAKAGIFADELALLTLAEWFNNKLDDELASARSVLSLLTAAGKRPHRENRPIEDDDEATALVAQHMRLVVSERFPVWRALGVF